MNAPSAVCKKCTTEKPLTEFYRDRSKPSGHHSICRTCTLARKAAGPPVDQEQKRAYLREYYHKNRETFREKALIRHYGMTAAAFAELLQAQGGVCAICRRGSERRLHVDHDHDTGEVRAILCSGCNRGLGFFNDDAARLRAAADYLSARVAA